MKVCKNRFAGISPGLMQLGLSVVCGLLMIGTLAADTTSRKTYALLIGCTKYQNECVEMLLGPSNDVGRYYQLLTDSKSGFAVPEANVKRLVGWPDNPELRPTYANITAAFEILIAQAAPNTQIFVLMAGHGVQVPVPASHNAYDAANPEPDGMDEVFLPADVQSWKEPDGLRNAIRDDQIGDWLERMRARGADVWIVFDCCHSGSMSRGTEELERPRSVSPQALGVPDAAIESALNRARAAAGGERSRGVPRFEVGALELNGKKKTKGKGSVVAFYAAQSWETAPELPRPKDSPPTKDHYYGLMSYTLAECLLQRQSPMSYRDLARLLVARYRADRRSRPPTPVFEGDLDREVLGVNEWPQRSVLLEHHEGKLRLSAGALRGLTRGSILAVNPPANDTRDPGTVLGYVEVTRLTPVTAEVTPCAFGDRQIVQADDLPELASCKVVSREFGDMRVKLAIRRPHDAGNTESVKQTENVSAALKKLSETVKPLVDVVADETQAEWVLQVATPELARREFGLALGRPTVLLLQGEGIASPVRKTTIGQALRPAAYINTRKIHGQYPASDIEQIAAELNRDLPKIFKWQNIWRIAGAVDDGSDGGRGGLIFDVVVLKHSNDESDGEPFDGTSLQAGQVIEYRFENDSDDDLWVAALFLDANFGIELYRARALKSGRAWSPIRVMITDETLGTEGMVVFTVPMSLCRNEPDYTFLQQEPLGVVDPLHKTRSGMRSSATPFEKLMRAATTEAGTRGGRILTATSNPSVLSRSWVTMPASTEAGQP